MFFQTAQVKENSYLYDVSLNALIHEPSIQIQASPIIPLNPHTLHRMVITDMKPAVQSGACN